MKTVSLGLVWAASSGAKLTRPAMRAAATLVGVDGLVGNAGWALALAHAKSGDAAMIAGYCGNSAALDDAMAKFALAYAKQTDRDHEALDKARRTGRIRVAAEQMA